MATTSKVFNYIKCGVYTDDNYNFLLQETGKNNNQIIRDGFDILNSVIRDYNNSFYYATLIKNAIELIKFVCRKQKFNAEEISINKGRIKKARGNLITCRINAKQNKEILLEAINLLDEIILDKNIDPIALIELIKKLIDKYEDINIIKKFISINKEAVTKTTELFDYVFEKAIDAIEKDDRSIYYYITLLKILWTTKINKNKYIAVLALTKKNEHTNEIYYIINGVRRPYDLEQILEKYNIISQPQEYNVLSVKKRSKPNTIITLDKSRTVLRDDAISIEKDGSLYIVKIYVADAGSEIIQFSNTDLDAKNNFKCLYLPKNRTRIFNNKVEEKLSLNENRFRKVIVLRVVLNNNGDIIDYYLSEDIINVNKNVSYAEADRILRCPNHDLFYQLNELKKLTEILQRKNGIKADYWNKKEINDTQPFRKYQSDTIIGELMVLYNRILALIANDKKIPFIYRIQEEEYISGLMKSLKIEVNDWTKNIINGLYLLSKYSTEPRPHCGLGFDLYSHSTDPLRRYSDTYNQYLLHHFYFKDKKMKFDEKEFKKLVNYFNQRNVELELMQAEYRRALELKRK